MKYAIFGTLLILSSITFVLGQNGTDCSKFSGKDNCGLCVQNASCMFCFSDLQCKRYPVGHILPGAGDCALNDARWGTCFVNFLALIIAMSIVAFLILIVMPCTIYCCCCRGKSGPSRRTLAENAQYDQGRSEREVQHAERRADREKKYDEIRSKYGMASHGTRPEAGYREFK